MISALPDKMSGKMMAQPTLKRMSVSICSAIFLAAGLLGLASMKLSAATFNPFQEAYVELTPPSELYENGACFTSMVVPLDVNYDGRQDLLAHYFCNDFDGSVAPEPTLDALMVYISDADGSFAVGNKKTFGAEQISLGGATRNYSTGDFNNDGRKDVVFAVNWEDGRPHLNFDSWDTEQTVLLSNERGYSIERVGEPVYGHGIGTVDNGQGYQDILTYSRSDWGGLDIAVLRWQGAAAEYVTQNYPAIEGGLTFGGVPSGEDGVLGAIYNGTDNGGIDYFKKIAGRWQESNAGDLERLTVETVTWVTWNGDPGLFRVSELEGKYYNNLGIVDSCYLPSTPELPGYIVGKFTGWYLGESYDENGTYYEMEQPIINKLVFFEVGESGVTRVNTPFAEEYPDDFFNFFSCRDLNQDGLPDIAVHNQTGNVAQMSQPFSGGAPRTYLRKPDGKFAVLDTSSFPKGEEDGTQLGLYADINGDGLEDLILYNTDPNIPLRVHAANARMSLPSAETQFLSLLKTLQKSTNWDSNATAIGLVSSESALIAAGQESVLVGKPSDEAVKGKPATVSSAPLGLAKPVPTLSMFAVGLLCGLLGVVGLLARPAK